MLGGLLDEAHKLRQDGVHTLQNSVTRALGYRQTFGWLQRISDSRSADASDVRQLVHDIAGPSRRLHKAQLTFHRDLEHFDWVDAREGASAAAAHIEAHFAADEHQGAATAPSLASNMCVCACGITHARTHLLCAGDQIKKYGKGPLCLRFTQILHSNYATTSRPCTGIYATISRP